jgi:hypothetical protein
MTNNLNQNRYEARVLIVFPEDQDQAVFDLWENAVVFNASGPREALSQAITLTRSLQQDNHALGYERAPLMYGVISLLTAHGSNSQCCHVLSKLGSIRHSELERLRSFNEITVPLSLMYIDDRSE